MKRMLEAKHGVSRLDCVTESSLPARAYGSTKDLFELQMFFNRHPSLRSDVADAALAAKDWFDSPAEPCLQLFDARRLSVHGDVALR